jgi:hypothetical protein
MTFAGTDVEHLLGCRAVDRVRFEVTTAQLFKCSLALSQPRVDQALLLVFETYLQLKRACDLVFRGLQAVDDAGGILDMLLHLIIESRSLE